MRHPDELSFRELDARNNWTKGTAFRHFKAALPQLVEGQDFYLLDANVDREQIKSLRTAGRIYATTVHAVLLGTRACSLIESN
jgi:predicted kinase